MSEIKLKPCPFCGDEEHITIQEKEVGGFDFFSVKCDKCGVRTYAFAYSYSAIESWNRRACDRKMREALERIVSLTNSLDENCAVDPVEIRDIAKDALSESSVG